MFSEQAQNTLRGLSGEGERINRQLLAGLQFYSYLKALIGFKSDALYAG